MADRQRRRKGGGYFFRICRKGRFGNKGMREGESEMCEGGGE